MKRVIAAMLSATCFMGTVPIYAKEDAAPVVETITDHEIKMKSDNATQYSIDGKQTWSETGVFTNLKPFTEYTVNNSKNNQSCKIQTLGTPSAYFTLKVEGDTKNPLYLYEYKGKGDTNDKSSYRKVETLHADEKGIYRSRKEYPYTKTNKGLFLVETKDGASLENHTNQDLSASYFQLKQTNGLSRQATQTFARTFVESEDSFLSAITVKLQNPLGEDLTGGLFALYAAEDIKDKDDNVIYEKDTLIDEKDIEEVNAVTFAGKLMEGKYYVTQKKAADGYVKSNQKVEFTLAKPTTENNIADACVEFENEETEVEISAISKQNKEVLRQIQLVLKDSNGNPIDSWTTVSIPKEIKKLTVGETYTLEQKSTYQGYVMMDAQTFTVNDRQGDTYTKQNVSFEVAPTETEFKVYDAKKTNGNSIGQVKVHIENANGEKVAITETGCEDDLEWTTSVGSKKSVKALPAGIYYIVIDEVPDGYVIPEKTKVQVTTAKELQSFSATVQPTNVQLQAIDSNTESLLTTTKVHVINKETGKAIDLKDYTTENTPKREVEGVTNDTPTKLPKEIVGLPKGTYEIIVDQVTAGYANATKKFEFTVTNDTSNTQMTKIKIQPIIFNVTASDMTTGDVLSGVEMSLLDEENKTLLENVKLKGEFSRLLEGNYKVKITTVPDGYVMPKTKTITVKNTAETQQFQIDLDYIKTGFYAIDEKTGDKLSNVTLKLKDAEGKTVKTWTQNDQMTGINRLPKGTYTISVESIPDGYVTPKDTEITVNETGELQLYQIKIPQSIIKVQAYDQDTTETLDGAKMHIENANGEIVANWTGDKNGKVIQKLPIGTYQIIVDSVPSGYAKPNKKQITIVDTMDTQMCEVMIPEITIGINTIAKDFNVALKNVKAHLEDTKGKRYATWNSTFETVIKKKIPIGTYRLIVDEVPEGFRIPKPQTIVVKETSRQQNYTVWVGVQHDVLTGSGKANLDENGTGSASKSVATSKEEKSSNVKTGDTHQNKVYLVYGIVGLLGIIAIAARAIYLKRKRK